MALGPDLVVLNLFSLLSLEVVEVEVDSKNQVVLEVPQLTLLAQAMRSSGKHAAVDATGGGPAAGTVGAGE